MGYLPELLTFRADSYITVVLKYIYLFVLILFSETGSPCVAHAGFVPSYLRAGIVHVNLDTLPWVCGLLLFVLFSLETGSLCGAQANLEGTVQQPGLKLTAMLLQIPQRINHITGISHSAQLCCC